MALPDKYKVHTGDRCVDPSTPLRFAQDDIWGKFAVFLNISTIDRHPGGRFFAASGRGQFGTGTLVIIQRLCVSPGSVHGWMPRGADCTTGIPFGPTAASLLRNDGGNAEIAVLAHRLPPTFASLGHPPHK